MNDIQSPLNTNYKKDVLERQRESLNLDIMLHTQFFRHVSHVNGTELCKYLWMLNESGLITI